MLFPLIDGARCCARSYFEPFPFGSYITHIPLLKKKNIVFILWGKKAQEKGHFLDRDNHLVIESTHPSPFSAHNGFFGSKPFSKTNEYLAKFNIDPIDWQL